MPCGAPENAGGAAVVVTAPVMLLVVGVGLLPSV